MVRFTSLLLVALVLAPGLAAAADVSAKSPDGNRIAAANGRAITVSDVATQRVVMKMLAHKADVSALAYAPDGKTLASADKDGAVALFDAATGKQLWQTKAVPGVNVLEISRDGRKVTAKAPGGSRVFNLATGKEVQ